MNNNNKKSLNASTALLPISAVAHSLGIHPRTLRIYDNEDILKPQRSEGDRRLYSINDIEKAKLILFLTRNLALNLSGVKLIFAMLEMMKVKPKNYLSNIENIAKIAKIDLEVQKENIIKASKKGRKPVSQKD